MYNVQFQNPSFAQQPQERQPQQQQQASSHDVSVMATDLRSNPNTFPSPFSASSLSPPPPPSDKTQAMMPPTNPSSSASRQSYETMHHPFNTPTPSFSHPAGTPTPQEGRVRGRKDHPNMYYTSQDVNQWAVATTAATAAATTAVPVEHTYSGKSSEGAMVSPTSTGSFDDEMQQRTMQQLFEKKRRRRESHNAVERRRRDNINERINELATLLPDRDAQKANKGTILRKSVEHIRLLHEKLSQYQHQAQELESLLEMYRMRDHSEAGAALMSSGHPLDLSTGLPSDLGGHDPFRRAR